MTQHWKPFDDGSQCEGCQEEGTGEALTDCPYNGFAWDGDEVRCTKCNCVGRVIRPEDERPFIHWEDKQ